MDYGPFKLFLTRKGLKPSTIRTHMFSLRRILEITGSDNLALINQFLLESSEKGLSNKYLNHLITSVRLYGQMNLRQDLITLPFLKEAEYIKSVMSEQEINDFLTLPPPTITVHRNGKTFNRPVSLDTRPYEIWTLFFSIMAFTGMRPGEVAHLTTDDVDFGQNVFVIRDSKTNTPRLVPIAENLKINVHKRVQEVKSGFLFASVNGGNHNGAGGVVDSVDWHFNFHKRIKRLGIVRKNLTPYSLRHSWITTMLSDDSVKLFDVKRVVGHKQSRTTEHYYAYTMKNLQRTVNKHPLARQSVDPRTILKTIKEAIGMFQLDEDQRFTYEILETDDELGINIKIRA